MRPTRVLAGVFVAAVFAGAGAAARSDGSSSPPPTFNLWNRPGIWHVTVPNNPPIGVGDGTWSAPDSNGATTGDVVGVFPVTIGGKTLNLNFNGVSTGSGRAVKGTIGGIGTDQSGLVTFAVKMSDLVRYEQFTGTYFASGSHGVHFSGTYQPGPATEETGTANLRVLFYAVYPTADYHLTTKKVVSLQRKNLSAQHVALVGVVQNTGPDLLPRGVAKFQFDIQGGRALGVELPNYFPVEKIIDPKPSYHAEDITQQSWVQEATFGALGSAKDRAIFGVEVVLPDGFALNKLLAGMKVASNAPGFHLTQTDAKTGAATTSLSIPIVDSHP